MLILRYCLIGISYSLRPGAYKTTTCNKISFGHFYFAVMQLQRPSKSDERQIWLAIKYHLVSLLKLLLLAALAVDIYCIILSPKLYTCQLHSY